MLLPLHNDHRYCFNATSFSSSSCKSNLASSSSSVLDVIKFWRLASSNAAAAIFFYLENAKIFSADIFPDLFRYHSNKINNFFVDTSSEESIQKNILSKKIFYDLIIEDAGHFFKDQII